ncbi:hypothetical protein VP01_322g6 [Puccinia sorghi]|uniref:Uncharacterized protein n=1 Tax=Puccinia sorghi TaxID=27349 RepID=A0A0L6UY55_9BASI|nr:hypothetical protein VP01_322g6 [Puccinia sorghi]
MALWHMLFVQKIQEQPMVYIWATCQAFKRPSRWEPWNDDRIPVAPGSPGTIESVRRDLAAGSWQVYQCCCGPGWTVGNADTAFAAGCSNRSASWWRPN